MITTKRKRGGAALRCGRCGRPTRVLRTTLTGKNVTRRDRVCPRDHRMVTFETPMSEETKK